MKYRVGAVVGFEDLLPLIQKCFEVKVDTIDDETLWFTSVEVDNFNIESIEKLASTIKSCEFKENISSFIYEIKEHITTLYIYNANIE